MDGRKTDRPSELSPCHDICWINAERVKPMPNLCIARVKFWKEFAYLGVGASVESRCPLMVPALWSREEHGEQTGPERRPTHRNCFICHRLCSVDSANSEVISPQRATGIVWSGGGRVAWLAAAEFVLLSNPEFGLLHGAWCAHNELQHPKSLFSIRCPRF